MADRRGTHRGERPRGPARRVRALAASIAAVYVAGVLGLGLHSADADTVEAPATISREAYFTNPLTQITPPLLRNGFPPATACLVAGLVGAPQVCGTEVQQISSLLGLSDGLPVLVTPDGDIAQPLVVPGTTPVGMLGGQQRYTSLLQLAIPPLPAGQRYGEFQLVLKQSGVNFALESPALRDVVLQIVAQLEDQDPQKITDAIVRAVSGEVPLATQSITGIEACPITQTWNGGPAQAASLDGSRLPDVNCLTGTTGVFDPKTSTFTFDLSFAVKAWTESEGGAAPMANEGILLRPLGAPNLAYGDPDLSTNWIVSLADSTAAAGLRPVIRYTTVPDETDLVTDTIPPIDLPPGGGGTDGGSGGLDLPSVPTTGGGTGAPAGGDRPVVRTTAFESESHTPGWVWIAIPLGLAAAYIFEQSLSATPAAARRRPGALSRLEADKS